MARNGQQLEEPALILLLMIQGERNNGTRENGAEPADVWRARRFIDEHSEESISLLKVAQAVHINPTHLSEKFKRVTGINFVDYVARMRFEKACALLQRNELAISEIAFAVGFQSLSQFNRVFKKFAGESPRSYRSSVRPTDRRIPIQAT